MPQPLAALDYSQLLRKTNFTKLVGISMKKFALIPFLCTGKRESTLRNVLLVGLHSR